jgi:hypothetical protein
MIKFSQFILETLSNPYPINWLARNKKSWIANVKADEQEIKIGIDQSGPGFWNVMFTVDGKTEKTGKGDQFRIFASVTKAIEEWWDFQSSNLDNVRTITFSADKSGNESRSKLYKRFADRLAKHTGFDIKIKKEKNHDIFVLTNPSYVK